MNSICQYCRAIRFKEEHDGSCCEHGQVAAPPLKPYPREFMELLIGDGNWAQNFHDHIRNYNSAMAFMSIGAQLEVPPGHGPFYYRIHGQIYHNVHVLHLDEGEAAKYGQLYILASATAPQERMGHPSNRECSPDIMRALDKVLHHINPYANAFKHIHEVEKEEATRSAQDNRELRPMRMIFASAIPDSDPRRYNAPSASEIAAVSQARASESHFSCAADLVGRVYECSQKKGASGVWLSPYPSSLLCVTGRFFILALTLANKGANLELGKIWT